MWQRALSEGFTTKEVKRQVGIAAYLDESYLLQPPTAPSPSPLQVVLHFQSPCLLSPSTVESERALPVGGGRWWLEL